MANFKRVKPSRNIEDRRKARIFPNEQERDEISNWEKSRQNRPLRDERDRKAVEKFSKSHNLRNNNADRQSDIVRDTKEIRKRISADYKKFISKK